MDYLKKYKVFKNTKVRDYYHSESYTYLSGNYYCMLKMKTACMFHVDTKIHIRLFTHSNEFFSIVTRNNILTRAFMMKPGSIKKFNNQLLMPYDNHLLDLDKIVNDSEAPNHTTGNSIRHVIETIAKFENPGMSLDRYVRDNEILSKDSCIFSLCQDLSHGNVRLETPYNEEVLREAAKTVIAFIKANYPGQLEAIR